MHLWHHAIYIPEKYGVNFGISLSLWDYLIKTDYIPSIDGNTKIGLPDKEKLPSGFLRQAVYPLSI